MWSNAACLWPDDRKRTSLFRLDVIRPLSVDPEIWPSVVGTSGALDRPEWTGPVQDLWDDLGRLRFYVNGRRHALEGTFWFIAVAVVPASCGREGLSLWADRVSEMEPPSIQPEWVSLGYDVADEYLESGLSNRVFRPGLDDAEELRATWGGELNEHHLFRSAAVAVEFASLADKRSPEHAPFCVYGIWRVAV